MTMLNVHNVMEEFVEKRVNALYNQIEKSNDSGVSCSCENCRLDTVTFVLNRIPPKYIVSGRGVTHIAMALEKDKQLVADIEKLAVEGMRLVNDSKRPYHQDNRKDSDFNDEILSAFNFPTFLGNVYDGQTFEPLADANVLLKLKDSKAPMVDVTWENPCKTYSSTEGSYSFWVKPLICEKEGELKKFTFTVEVSAPNYETSSYSFTIPLSSEKIQKNSLNSAYSLKIQNIFLFRSDFKQ